MVHNVVNFVKKNRNLLIFCMNCGWLFVFVNLFCKSFREWGWYCAVGWGMCVWWFGKNGRHFRVGEVPPLFIF